VIAYDREELAITLFEESGDALFLFDPNTEAMIDANPMAERLTGFTYGELLRLPVTHLFRSEGTAALHRLRHAFQRTGLFHSQEDFLLRHRKEGVWIPVNLTVTRLHARPATLGLITVRDISEHKRLEEQLRQAQKLEAIGRLAGGVAHDFNNLLTVITGYSSLLSLELAPDDPNQNSVEMIRATAERAAGLTRQLLAFGRKQVLRPVILDLNAVIKDVEPMLRRLIGEDVRLVTALEPILGRITADRSQIEQVLVNLVVNARDAMPEGGCLSIETNNETLDLTWPASRTGANVVLTVSDTGIGMDEHTRAHLFEPFFTTKEVGKGTGLGLATVYGIVQQSGGQIAVHSELGCGSMFKITLPRAAELHDPSLETTPCPGHCRSEAGRETILLVEDEESVRILARTILQQNGYTILEAEHGAEALSVCQSHAGRLDLLLTDVVMPLMGGRELADRLALIRPEVKVLFMSGHTDDTLLRRGVMTDDMAFLPKPFTPAGLVHTVREVLDRKSVLA
jgi:two-component system cell cycle sensor histidine kinase/response regulator CckA